MIHQFLPCLMQLKLSCEDDQAYIAEIQRVWCLLLDRFESESRALAATAHLFSLTLASAFLATERSLSLEDFLQRLLEQPVGQHYHSVSINKNQLIERYEETVRDLVQRYPVFGSNRLDEQRPTVRSNRTSNVMATVQIPIVFSRARSIPQHRTGSIPVIYPRGSSPMQQDDDGQEPSPAPAPPSSS